MTRDELIVAISRLEAEFKRLLTEDSQTDDRRRREYNQAIFMEDGNAVFTRTTLDMVMDKFKTAAYRTVRKDGDQ